jgi:hypothetical protein
LISLQGLDLGGKGRTPGVDTHVVAIDETGAITSFDMRDWSTDPSGNMDIEDDQVMGNQHPEPIWSPAIRDMAEGHGRDQSEKPWAEKAKTKHKILDLRDIWLGTSDSAAATDS